MSTCGAAIAPSAQEIRSETDLVRRVAEYRRPDGSLGICAWCQAEFKVKPGPDESHGICARHLEKLKAELATRVAATKEAA